MSNLWEEHWQNLNFSQENSIVPILALAADELTENVFVITENFPIFQDFTPEKIQEFCDKMMENVRKYPDLPIPQDLKNHLVQNEGLILMRNPLMIKKRNLCQSEDEKLQTLNSLKKL